MARYTMADPAKPASPPPNVPWSFESRSVPSAFMRSPVFIHSAKGTCGRGIIYRLCRAAGLYNQRASRGRRLADGWNVKAPRRAGLSQRRSCLSELSWAASFLPSFASDGDGNVVDSGVLAVIRTEGHTGDTPSQWRIVHKHVFSKIEFNTSRRTIIVLYDYHAVATPAAGEVSEAYFLCSLLKNE